MEAEIIEDIHESLSSHLAERTPAGNWAKNYAALSVHRRDDWVVTVKGFNHYVLGPERYTDENVYGLFGAHGAILTANDEQALKTKNVDRGWDWTKMPGTTAVEMTDMMKLEPLKAVDTKTKKHLQEELAFTEQNPALFTLMASSAWSSKCPTCTAK